MPKTRPPYSPEFRRQMVDLVRAGRDPADLAREFEPTAQSICRWATVGINGHPRVGASEGKEKWQCADGKVYWRDKL